MIKKDLRKTIKLLMLLSVSCSLALIIILEAIR